MTDGGAGHSLSCFSIPHCSQAAAHLHNSHWDGDGEHHGLAQHSGCRHGDRQVVVRRQRGDAGRGFLPHSLEQPSQLGPPGCGETEEQATCSVTWWPLLGGLRTLSCPAASLIRAQMNQSTRCEQEQEGGVLVVREVSLGGDLSKLEPERQG